MNIGSAAYGGEMSDDSAPTAPVRPVRPERPARRRLVALALLMLTVAAGLAVHTLAPDGALSDIAGDALYAVAAYLAVVILLPRQPKLAVALIAAAWCLAVELFQLTGVPLALGAEFPPVMLVLGTVFDGRDVVVYPVTVLIVALIDGGMRGLRRAPA